VGLDILGANRPWDMHPEMVSTSSLFKPGLEVVFVKTVPSNGPAAFPVLEEGDCEVFIPENKKEHHILMEIL
jgi:hypothetical protein